MSPELGTYVRYDHELLGGVVATEVARAGALAIGEDLGTVEPWLPKFLAARHVLGTSMLWFERRADGTPRRPGGWRRGWLAAGGTRPPPRGGLPHRSPGPHPGRARPAHPAGGDRTRRGSSGRGQVGHDAGPGGPA